MRRLVASNRRWLAHAALLASSRLDIRQFLDLGSGFPGPGSVREAVQAADPAATAVCVDQDGAVARYGSRLASEGVKAANVVTADITDPAAVLAHPAVTETVDLAEPVCMVLGMVANAMEPQQAREVIAGYVQTVAPGSALVVTAAVNEDDRLSGALSEAWKATGQPLVSYTLAEVGALFGTLEILPPGGGASRAGGIWPAVSGRQGGAEDVRGRRDRAQALGGVFSPRAARCSRHLCRTPSPPPGSPYPGP